MSTILYIPQQGRGQIEEVPIYPGVMVAIERLVFSVRARVYNCSKRGIQLMWKVTYEGKDVNTQRFSEMRNVGHWEIARSPGAPHPEIVPVWFHRTRIEFVMRRPTAFPPSLLHSVWRRRNDGQTFSAKQQVVYSEPQGQLFSCTM